MILGDQDPERKEIVLAHDLLDPLEHSLKAAFIVGSVAAGSDRPSSDIDLLLCLAKIPRQREAAEFLRRYYRVHEELGRVADHDYPGETPLCSRLRFALDIVRQTPPQHTLLDPTLYDGIVWAGMLSGPKIELVPPDDEVRDLENLSHLVVEAWVTALSHGGGVEGVTPDKFLKREVHYRG